MSNSKKIQRNFMPVLDLVFSVVVGFVASFVFFRFFLTSFKGELGKLGYWFGVLAGLGFAFLYLYWRYKNRLRMVMPSLDNDKFTIKVGLQGGIFLSVLGFPYVFIFGSRDVPNLYYLNPSEGTGMVFLFIILLGIVVPLVEEMYFRGLVFRILNGHYSLTVAYFGSSILFGLAHSLSIKAFLNSFVYFFIFNKTKQVKSSVISHAIANSTWLISIYLFK